MKSDSDLRKDSGFTGMDRVPQTKEEAISALMHGKGRLMGRCLVGIFLCHIGRGDSLLAAYEAALLAHVASYEKGISQP